MSENVLALIPRPLYIFRKIYYGQLRFKDQNDHLSDSFTHFKLIAGAFFRTYFIPSDLLSDFVLFQETVRRTVRLLSLGRLSI